MEKKNVSVCVQKEIKRKRERFIVRNWLISLWKLREYL